jgi:general secretion pathway protein D
MTQTSRTSPLIKPVALLCISLVLNAGPTFAGSSTGGSGSVSGLAEREIARRNQRQQEAQAAIEKGDKFFANGDYESALNEYKTALDIIPEAPLTQALRDQTLAKYCNAAVELARERAKAGRYTDAKALLKDVLERDPDHKGALVLSKQIEDPDRFEPANNPKHTKDVADATRSLQLAASYENLAEYDSAIKEYQEVLRIDKYNTTARRGMERVEQRKSQYFDSARDHQRARMLNMVNEGWEEKVPITVQGGDMNTIYGGTADASRYYTEKMAKIIFPQVQFQGASIEEAIEFLRIKSKDIDTIERDPSRRGVNLILKAGAAPSTAQITLDLHDVPMQEALRYITELAGMKYKIEPYAVVVVPLTETTTEQFTKQYKVPPDFLSSGGGDAGGAAPAGAAPDPFAAAAPAGGGGIKGKPGAKEILMAAGISFPDGASASFISATSLLVVRNTQPNLDAIEAFVEALRKKIPQQIYITTKFVEVTQKNTDELGFDWLVGAFNLPTSSSVFGSGGTAGNSTSGAVSSADFPFNAPGGSSPVGQYPVSRGLRSGSGAITPDSIDGLINAKNIASNLAPGVFALSGVFTDPQFQVVIRALSQKKGVDLMSAPSVTTRSGQRATIEVAREFRYPTEFSPPQIPQTIGAQGAGIGAGLGGGAASSFPVTPTTPTAFEMRPVGVRMEVDPVLGPDGFTIDLNLAPEVTEFDGFINYGSPIQSAATDAFGNPTTITLTENKILQPVFSTRKVTTAVTIWDGQTVAMGGLIREDVQDVEDKVPLLGDLPIIGRLFQSKAEDHFKRNLMVFVTAKLIDPSGQPVRVSVPNAGSAAGAAPDTASATGGPGVLPPPVMGN